jgi:creatinine amidohydrolase
MERQLQRMNWLQIRELVPDRIDTAILPVGTVEGHGPSCVGTDNIIPENLADDVADSLDAIVAPTIPFGVTKSLYRYPGGITIEPDVFGEYVRQTLNSLHDSGFANIFVFNGHGGNNSALKEVAYRFHRECDSRICVVHWWELCSDMTVEHYGHTGGHGGTDETAMVHAIDEDLVDQSVYDKDLAYWYRRGANVYPVPGSILLYKEGEGYPEFDLEKDKEYYRKVAREVAEFCRMVRDRWRRYEL